MKDWNKDRDQDRGKDWSKDGEPQLDESQKPAKQTAIDGAAPLESGARGDADDCRRRVAMLRRHAAELSGGQLEWNGVDQLPPEIEEVFWQQIIAYETAEAVSLFDLLTAGGVSLPAPVLVHEERIVDKLWEVIYFLAAHGCYLESTDHLSDRELYTVLWEKLLREPAILFPDDPRYAYHLDIIGSGSREDQRLFLTYYADENDRRLWAGEWPHEPLPAAIPRPYDRDRLLPRPWLHEPGMGQVM